jgi:transposase InsO family protein
LYCTTAEGQRAIRTAIVAAYQSGMSVSKVSAHFKVATTTVYRWLHRDSVVSRSMVPRFQPRKVPPSVEAEVRRVREQTRYGPWRIAQQLGMKTSTVYKILCRQGINRLAPLQPQPPPTTTRYEWARPGELVHVDVKKLLGSGLVPQPKSVQRYQSYQCLHVMLDDCSRVVFQLIYPDETAASATEFLERGITWLASLGVRVQRVLTDNGPAYTSEQWRNTCQLLELQHRRIRPYRPQTNGKVERWNRTLMEEALAGTFLPSLEARAAVIDNFVNAYNTRRPHKALNGKTPFQRLAERSGRV